MKTPLLVERFYPRLHWAVGIVAEGHFENRHLLRVVSVLFI